MSDQKSDVWAGTGYCVKCKEKREFSGAVSMVGAAGDRRMARGTCPVCGTTVTRILGKKDATTTA